MNDMEETNPLYCPSLYARSPPGGHAAPNDAKHRIDQSCYRFSLFGHLAALRPVFLFSGHVRREMRVRGRRATGEEVDHGV